MIFLSRVAGLCLCLCLTCSGAELRRVGMKTIGTPVATARQWTWGVMADAGGKWQFIGQYYNYAYGKESPDPEWLIVDLESGRWKVVSLPGYANTNYYGDNLMRAENGRCFFTTGDGRIHYYEPSENTMKSLGAMFPDDKGYSLLYRQIRSPDGKMYFGAQSNNGQAGLVRLDPETLETKSFAKVANIQRKEALTYVYFLAADPPWVYLAVGKGLWQLVAFNPDTGEGKILRDNCSWVSFDTDANGVRAGVREVDPSTGGETSSRVWCQNGALYPEVDGKRPELPGKTLKERFPKFFEDKPASRAPTVTSEPPDKDGMVKLRVKPGPGGEERTLHGKISNVRGIKVESLGLLPDGDLFGNCAQYSQFFRYSPKSGKIDVLGKANVSGPVLTSCGGKVYYSGYPGGLTFVYDPDKPWLPAESIPPSRALEANPRQLKYLGGECSGAHFAYSLVPASNGRLYFLGRLERGHQGAGVAYLDLQSELAVGHSKNLNFLKPHNLLVMERARRVIISGRLLKDDPNTTASPPEEAELVVFDMDLNEVERLRIRKGLTSTGHLYPAPDGDEFIGCVSYEGVNAFYRYSLKEKRVVEWNDVDGAVDKVMTRPDKSYWTLQGAVLGRLDPVSLRIVPFGVLPKIPSFCVWRGGKLYGAVEGDLVEFDTE